MTCCSSGWGAVFGLIRVSSPSVNNVVFVFVWIYIPLNELWKGVDVAGLPIALFHLFVWVFCRVPGLNLKHISPDCVWIWSADPCGVPGERTWLPQYALGDSVLLEWGPEMHIDTFGLRNPLTWRDVQQGIETEAERFITKKSWRETVWVSQSNTINTTATCPLRCLVLVGLVLHIPTEMPCLQCRVSS